MKLPRHAEIWLRPYLADATRKLLRGLPPVRHIWLAVADHFEPFWNRVDYQNARQRVEAWRNRWPKIAASVGADHANSPPRYTFFYPVEQYNAELLDMLAEMTRDGIADVEVHLHHDGEGREDFIARMRAFCQILVERHGLLRTVNGRTRFGFIHGNWALDNSLPSGRWCGLNDEITLLRDLGCYADFTMPSGAFPSQATMINTVYWCTDDPHMPKSYDRGKPVRAGEGPSGDLLMIPGPLGLRWGRQLLPRLETGEIAAYDQPTAYRARRWFDLAPRVGEHVFLKLYTHGATESNLQSLLSTGLCDLFRLAREEAERREAKIHFVSAWQMYLAIEAISKGNDPQQCLSAGVQTSYQSSDERSGSLCLS
jgi:hypothetical protein